ncbi:MAG: type II toxin-antitoxin system VapC family toxin [Candidatus Rokuibacteriota bacterium]
MVDSLSAYVLDAFAVLAYLEGEAGMRRVRAVLDGAGAGRHRIYLSVISLGEVLYIVERERGLVEAQRALAAVDQLPLEVLPVTRTTVLAAAHVKARFPLSEADAFVAVAAQDHGAIVLTGDPEFEPVTRAGLVTIERLPRR